MTPPPAETPFSVVEILGMPLSELLKTNGGSALDMAIAKVLAQAEEPENSVCAFNSSI